MKTFVPFFVVLLGFIFVSSALTTNPEKEKSKLVKKFLKQRSHLAEVPSGYLYNGEDSLKIATFYISKYECSNIEYLEFYYDMFRKDSVYAINNLQLNHSLWKNCLNYSEPYEKYYWNHPAYKEYPVVNVSYEQAQQFCEWLTNRYNNHPKKTFQKILVRLPSKREWEYAALGGLKISPFPWGGPYVRNSEGSILANFLRLYDANIKRDETGKLTISEENLGMNMGISEFTGSTDVVAPVKSYWPNGYGLYNMAGNAAEFVAEKGICKGGNWKDPGYYLQIKVDQQFDSLKSAAPNRGFRYVVEIVEE